MNDISPDQTRQHRMDNFQNYDQKFDKNFENFKKFEKENVYESTGFSSGYDTRQSLNSDAVQSK